LFIQQTLTPRLWLNSAASLAEAAERLTGDIARFWEATGKDGPVPLSVLTGIGFQKIFMMLYGFSIENLCKAYVVTQLDETERRQIEQGQLPKRIGNHSIVNLVTIEIRMEIDINERELLKRLEQAVLWAGRYPVSTGPGLPKEKGDQAMLKRVRKMPQGITLGDVSRTRNLRITSGHMSQSYCQLKACCRHEEPLASCDSTETVMSR
jgi:hypothetical protein